MSKVTRNELKDLVKECLVEILSEGLASPARRDNTEDLLEDRRSTRQIQGHPRASMPPRSQSPALNSTVFGSGQAKRPVPAPTALRRPAIMDSVGQITSDPIMSQILADTAMTTLQEQIGAEASRPGSPSMEESVGSPTDLFEGAQHWATLAFSDGSSRGQNLKS